MRPTLKQLETSIRILGYVFLALIVVYIYQKKKLGIESNFIILAIALIALLASILFFIQARIHKFLPMALSGGFKGGEAIYASWFYLFFGIGIALFLMVRRIEILYLLAIGVILGSVSVGIHKRLKK